MDRRDAHARWTAWATGFDQNMSPFSRGLAAAAAAAASSMRLAVLGASAARDSINLAVYWVQMAVVLSDMMSDEQYRQKMMDGSGIKHTSFCKTAGLCFSDAVTR